MSLFSGEVKVPGVGEVPKAAVAGGVAVVGVLAVVYVQRKKAASAAAAAAPAAASSSSSAGPYPPDGTTGNPDDPNSTDPATGLTYGDEQYAAAQGSALYDEGAYAGSEGAVSSDAYPWDGTTGNPSDPYSMDPSTGITYGDEGYAEGSTSAPAGEAFTSNATWAQYAQNYLVGTVGLDSGTVSAALGAYITGAAVTSAQQDIINQAIAFAGTPPVAGANGNPPGINLSASPSSPSGTGSNPSTPSTPSAPSTPSGPSAPSAPSASGPAQISVTGQTLEYGIPALEAAGWTINNVTITIPGQAGIRTESAQTYAQAGYPASQASAVITGTTWHAGAGVGGQWFPNSVDVAATGT